MALTKVEFVNGPLEVFTVQDENQEKWMVANPFAEALGYAKPNKVVLEKVSAENQKSFEEINPYRFGTTDDSSLLPRNVQAKTKFINRAGVFELISASEMPAAKRFKTWNTNDLLPTLCAEGEYSMSKDAPSDIAQGMNAVHVATNEGREAPWMKDLEEFKVVLAEKDRKIDKLTNALIQSNEKNNTLTQALIAVTERTDKLANRIIDLAQDVVTKPSNPNLCHSLAVCALGGDQYAFLRPQKRNMKRSLDRLSVDNREIVFKSEYVPNAMNVLNKVKENLPRDKFKARHNKITLLEDLTKEDLVDAIDRSLTQRQVAIIAKNASANSKVDYM
uniref:BRO-N n=1 Tax=Lymantria dispar multicapsid nuclear polyhedrosis virus TaxID=10449 RepID=A0A4P8NIU7_NPVLD|nr:BRO-N [Lymantria dispar multiple nucleopolyhedrovirus]QCQ67565.1 BRO-N [Lymantria dispar multiple nucleopolyhedrovirus]QCQ67723.1 BRO-N [Lymantria dispar multiple nucleopolyhedrovirus]